MEMAQTMSIHCPYRYLGNNVPVDCFLSNFLGTPMANGTSTLLWVFTGNRDEGSDLFRDESKLLILCDAGGSNGYRVRNWKKQLQKQLADRFNIEVMVCHYPPETSKWNPIEHRLFSFIL